ncbi:nuclear transport factor 2 family protein [Actinomadura sp. 21ATH]|uniref:nuclear transport factor 2 family protein n=1 Tax=Actinomadura sp. 21ATH TaxID=1735444 RepID=UPI0035BEFCAE
MHPFRQAVEDETLDIVPAMLADDVTFISPVAFTPYTGKDLVLAILHGAFAVFEDLRYVKELASPDGTDHALMFTARIGDRQVNGCDFVHHNDEGLIDEFCVMVRPLSAARALSEAMAIQFESIRQELGVA